MYKTILFVFLSSLLSAQDYSYFSDKKFLDPVDLIGYNFVPASLEIPNEREEDLEAGEYTFGISRSNLYVKGGEIEGVYNINNINTTEYGFMLKLISARDSRRQGHLKVILANKYYVDALIFRGSVNEAEMIFLLPSAPDDLRAEEKAYFTDRTEIELAETDSIWGMQFRPFFRVYTQEGNIQERLHMEDSTVISFVEEVKLIEKTKKEKTKKKNEEVLLEEENLEKSEESEALESEEELEVAESEIEEELSQEEELVEQVVKVKEIREYFIDLKTLRKNADGSLVEEKKRYTIKKIKEREDEQAQGNEERYQLEMETNKGLVYVYLTARKTISSVELFGERYLMRGH